MTRSLEQAISDRKKILQSQYAYIAEIEELAELRASRRLSENPYHGADELERFSRPIRRFDGLPVEPDRAAGTARANNRKTEQEIKDFVRSIHLQMWENRAEVFSDFAARQPVDMLDPIAALRLLGYSVEIGGALGQIAGHGGRVSNVAGIIDKATRQVLLSSGMSPEVRNFTAAHELAHAAMHEFAGMHRDKPLDGGAASGDYQEKEADRFAALFLMPEKLMRRMFEAIFGSAPFRLDESTRFALGGSLPSDRWQPRNRRDLSRILAGAQRYNGCNVISLMNQFRVSKEAMAIRLEELDLVSLEPLRHR